MEIKKLIEDGAPSFEILDQVIKDLKFENYCLLIALRRIVRMTDDSITVPKASIHEEALTALKGYR